MNEERREGGRKGGRKRTELDDVLGAQVAQEGLHVDGWLAETFLLVHTRP